jgi:hypothetical protein
MEPSQLVAVVHADLDSFGLSEEKRDEADQIFADFVYPHTEQFEAKSGKLDAATRIT